MLQFCQPTCQRHHSELETRSLGGQALGAEQKAAEFLISSLLMEDGDGLGRSDFDQSESVSCSVILTL